MTIIKEITKHNIAFEICQDIDGVYGVIAHNPRFPDPDTYWLGENATLDDAEQLVDVIANDIINKKAIWAFLSTAEGK